MSFLGTFDGFTTARLGIIAAQNGLNLTGNNVSNINTKGYTRQVLDQVAMKTGGHDRYASTLDLHMGSGTLCTGISQIRDPYLDIRYRNEIATVGTHDTWLGGLNNIAAYLDETGDGTEGFGMLTERLSDFSTALQNLNTYTGQQDYDILVRSAASALCEQFNAYANELETLYSNTQTALETDVNEVNSILSSIQALNVQIRKGDIHGDPCLELRDDRNVLIDELAQYMKIDVIYETEDLGGGDWVEKLVIKLGNANPDPTVTETDTATLVDGVYVTQFAMPEKLPEKNLDYNPAVTDPTKPGYGMYLKDDGSGTNDINEAAWTNEDNSNYDLFLDQLKDPYGRVIKEHSMEVAPIGKLDDNDLYGSLQSTRELLTECGEFASADTINTVDENAAVKRGIPYYQKALDLLANKLAATYNETNNGFMQDQDGKDLGNPHEFGGNLFSHSGDGNEGDGITAKNISVSLSWAKGDVHIVPTYIQLFGGDVNNSTQDSNIQHMITLFESALTYDPNDLDLDAPAASTHLFEGSFHEMLNNIWSVLGNDQRSTGVMLNTSYASSLELDTSRDGVMGVDLNDETINMMKYQKALTAAYRILTVLDEVLDKLINNTAV